MLYALINMSDAYTFRADTLECAALVTCFLGNGQYGARPLEGDGDGVPIFLLGGSEEWFAQEFGRSLEETFDLYINGSKRPELIAALRSVLIGSARDREDCEAALAVMHEADRAKWLAERHERHRSSMNDIGSRAQKIADKLEDYPAIKPLPTAPVQVFVG